MGKKEKDRYEDHSEWSDEKYAGEAYERALDVIRRSILSEINHYIVINGVAKEDIKKILQGIIKGL